MRRVPFHLRWPSHRDRKPQFRYLTFLPQPQPSSFAFEFRRQFAPLLAPNPPSPAFRLSKIAKPYHSGTTHAGNETSGSQGQESGRTCILCRGKGRRKRQHHAQAGADVRDPQAARDSGNRHYRRRRGRGSIRWIWISALTRCQLSAGAGRYLCLALADPPLRPAHRRHAGRPDPFAEGRRALFRAAQGQLR